MARWRESQRSSSTPPPFFGESGRARTRADGGDESSRFERPKSLSEVLLERLLCSLGQLWRGPYEAVGQRWANERDLVLRRLVGAALALLLIAVGLGLLIGGVLVLCWQLCGPILMASIGGVLLLAGALCYVWAARRTA